MYIANLAPSAQTHPCLTMFQQNWWNSPRSLICPQDTHDFSCGTATSSSPSSTQFFSCQGCQNLTYRQLEQRQRNVCLNKKTILGLKCYLQHNVWQPWSFEGEKWKTGFNFCNPKWPALGFLQCHWRKAMPKKWRLQYKMRGYSDQAGCNLWWSSPKY